MYETSRSTPAENHRFSPGTLGFFNSSSGNVDRVGWNKSQTNLKYPLPSISFKVEEFVMLVDPKLSLFTGDETTYGSYEADRPQHRITQFRFDPKIHLKHKFKI